jgi:hypothetical protein
MYFITPVSSSFWGPKMGSLMGSLLYCKKKWTFGWSLIPDKILGVFFYMDLVIGFVAKVL